MGDVVLGAKAGHLLASEFSYIVRDHSVRDPKMTYYVLPEELDNLLLADLGKQHCLNPFGEVVGGYQ